MCQYLSGLVIKFKAMLGVRTTTGASHALLPAKENAKPSSPLQQSRPLDLPRETVTRASTGTKLGILSRLASLVYLFYCLLVRLRSTKLEGVRVSYQASR